MVLSLIPGESIIFGGIMKDFDLINFSICGWMLTYYKLKNTELLVFAVINSFTGANGSSGWYGAARSLAKLCACSERQAQRALLSLKTKGYITEGVYTFVDTGTQMPLYNAVRPDVVFKQNKAENVTEEKKPQKTVKERKEPKEKSDNALFKEAYQRVVDIGYKTKVLPTYIQAMNSALINTRIKALLDKGVTPEMAEKVFMKMLTDNFCVQKLGFGLAALTSEGIFCKVLNEVQASTPVERPKLPQKKVCPKCGKDTLDGDGLCLICDEELINQRLDREIFRNGNYKG